MAEGLVRTVMPQEDGQNLDQPEVVSHVKARRVLRWSHISPEV